MVIWVQRSGGPVYVGGFYAFTSLSPAPAQVVDLTEFTKLQLGPDEGSDWENFGDNPMPGFALDTSTSPSEQIVIPAGDFLTAYGRVAFVVSTSTAVRCGLTIVDDTMAPVVAIQVDDTVAPGDNLVNFTPSAPFSLPAGGFGYLWTGGGAGTGSAAIASNGYLEVDYDTSA